MKKSFLLLLLIVFLGLQLNFVEGKEVYGFASRLNYFFTENTTIVATWNGSTTSNATVNITVPQHFTESAASGSCSSPTSNTPYDLTCVDVPPGGTVFVTLVTNASLGSHVQSRSDILAVNSSGAVFFGSPINFVRIQDVEIFHTLVEFGRGRGNYFFDTFDENASGSKNAGLGFPYLPNGTLFELNFLHKMNNIKQYLEIPKAKAINATFTCSYPNVTLVRDHAVTNLTLNTTAWTITYLIHEIEGSWERLGFVGLDFPSTFYPDPGANISVHCTRLVYTLPDNTGAYESNGNVTVNATTFTLFIRSIRPFNITASTQASFVGLGSQEVEITYNISHNELYPIKNAKVNIFAPEFAKFIGVRGSQWGTSRDSFTFEKENFDPGSFETITLVALFNTSGLSGVTSLNLSAKVDSSFIPSWEFASYNPIATRQVQVPGVNETITVDLATPVDILILNEVLQQLNTSINAINSSSSSGNITANVTVNPALLTEIITRIRRLQSFDEEVVFLITDAFNVQQQAVKSNNEGDRETALVKLRESNSLLNEAAGRLKAQKAEILEGTPTIKEEVKEPFVFSPWTVPIALAITLLVVVAFLLMQRPRD